MVCVRPFSPPRKCAGEVQRAAAHNILEKCAVELSMKRLLFPSDLATFFLSLGTFEFVTLIGSFPWGTRDFGNFIISNGNLTEWRE